MYYQICISGTSTPVEETKNLKTVEDIQTWFEANQINKPAEGEEGFDTWEYEDETKFIYLEFNDDGTYGSQE